MVSTKFFVTAAAVSAPLVAGHGYMGLPKVTFNGGDITAPAGTISSSQFKAPSGMSFTTDPNSNTKAFTAWIATSEYKSLKDLIVKKGGISECGNSKLGDAQPLPDKVEWTHSSSEGFTQSHEGPCEIWCDDQMAFHDDNCAKNYPAAPAKLPYDKSKCTGAKKMTAYWLALHSPDWQMYVNCAALSGSGGSSGGGSAPAPAPAATTTPTVRPSTPSTNSPPAATPAPAAGDDDCDEYPEPDDDDCDDDLPEPDCDDDLPEPSDDAAGEADDCDDDLPEPDCDDDLPEPDADCDDDLPEPDCDDDLPEPEYGGEADVKTSDINFSTYQRSADDAPGKVYPEDY